MIGFFYRYKSGHKRAKYEKKSCGVKKNKKPVFNSNIVRVALVRKFNTNQS